MLDICLCYHFLVSMCMHVVLLLHGEVRLKSLWLQRWEISGQYGGCSKDTVHYFYQKSSYILFIYSSITQKIHIWGLY